MSIPANAAPTGETPASLTATPAPEVAPADPAAVAPVAPAEPAAPAVEAPTPAPAPEVIGDPAPSEGDTNSETAVTYQPTGDAGLDIALDFIGGLGLGPDHSAVVAAAEGNFDKLEATLEAMGDKAKGSDRYVALAKQAYEKTAKETEATQAAVTATVHEVAGSEDNWKAIKEWSGKNADQSEKDAINAMLTAGPLQARAAAVMLTNAYNAAGGTVVTPASALKDNAGNGNNSPSDGALSPADYHKEVSLLRGKLGGRMDGSDEYKQLQARRQAYRA